MSKVSRSIYQKEVEKNKRLTSDIKTLIYGSIPEIIFLKDKWRKRFESEKRFNQMMKELSKTYMDNNPNDPAVIAVKELNKKISCKE